VKIPGSLALGLLAAFAAHAAVYGGEHEMGGAFHAALVLLAIFSALGGVTAWLAVGWACGDRLGDGTIVAANLARVLPPAPAVFVSATAWFWLAESIEDGHADAPLAVLAIALAIASVLVAAAAKAALRAIAGIVFRPNARRFVAQTPFWDAASPAQLAIEPVAHIRRRFARPPPVGARA
jgi:hypothetical protein